ncbi:MAG: M28 family peptidase [Gammaproteobacteria bacterium]|nr:M28 family peptidase [Gammaproteobacteria bacterium]
MKFTPFATLIILAAAPAAAEDTGSPSDPAVIPARVAANAVALRDRALEDNLSVDIVESVTTEVGARRMGTEGDQRVIAWAQAKFTELGFDRAWTEPVELDRGWDRGEAKAAVLEPFAHDIIITALGYSVGTDGDLVAEIVEFPTYDDLLAVPEGDSLKGKIAFVSYGMPDYVNPEDGSNRGAYGEGTRARGKGRVEAARRGAEALVIRSVGMSHNRFGHTGSGYNYEEDVRKIPAAAVSAPDAMLIQNILRRGKPVVFKMNLTSRFTGPQMSANIIGEITGREDPDRFVLLGAHVDSWDESTGALDDGAGIGSMMAAAAFIGQMDERPRRSIRVILFSGEEIGFYGVNAYIEKHRDNIDAHLLGAEVDTGGGRANTLSSRVGAEALGVVREMHRLVEPLGIEFNDANDVHAQSDMSVLSKAGMPALHLRQNPNGYFMYHHTPNDTFDKIIPEDMRYLTAAYATLFYVAAELDVDFRN